MRLRLLLAAACAAAAAAVPVLATGAQGQDARADAFFVTPCLFSHRAPDDPIVAPGRPAASHSHDFFGNRSTNAHSTHDSLLRAGTTCGRRDDTAAYWVPTLYVDGRPVRPLRAQIYFRAAGKDPRSVRPHPQGLRVIAGDSKATNPQDPRVTHWHCGPGGGVEMSQTVPTCPSGRRLVLRIRFPDCWDGRNLDSPDHKSHMAYAQGRRCPSSHPVPVPRIAMNVRYPIAGGSGVTLASKGANSAHADFFNAWRPGGLARLVARCINRPNGHRHPCTPGGKRLGLTVSPRRVKAGRAVRFHFRVTHRRAGRPVPVHRALVSFGGRRVRTNSRGRASIVRRFSRRGVRRAVVSAGGFRGRAVTVRVR